MTWRVWYQNGKATLATRMEYGRVKSTEPTGRHWKMALTADKMLPVVVALIHESDRYKDWEVGAGELPPVEAISG